MRKFAVLGLLGVAVATGSAGFASASDEIVVARLTIEAVSDTDSGYATSATRSIDVIKLLNEMPANSAQMLPEIQTGSVAVPQPAEEELETAAIIVPSTRPDFESSKAITAPAREAAPRPEVMQRRVIKVDNRVERKRAVTIPMPVAIGVFR